MDRDPVGWTLSDPRETITEGGKDGFLHEYVPVSAETAFDGKYVLNMTMHADASIADLYVLSPAHFLLGPDLAADAEKGGSFWPFPPMRMMNFSGSGNAAALCGSQYKKKRSGGVSDLSRRGQKRIFPQP